MFTSPKCSSFLALGLFLYVGGVARSQNSQSAFLCTPATVPTLARSGGLTELVGDMVLSCTGGIPTPLDAPVPKSNIQVFLNTNITSRILANGGISEALLLVDEPFPSPPSTAV